MTSLPKPDYDLILARDAALRRAELAEQRERVAAEAYNGQQQSYRELETLYQAAQERALRAEADAAALQNALEPVERHRKIGEVWVELSPREWENLRRALKQNAGEALLAELARRDGWAKRWKHKAKGHRANFHRMTRLWSALLLMKVKQDRELEAARKIVTTLRRHMHAGGEVWGSIDRDLAAYDAAVKGE